MRRLTMTVAAFAIVGIFAQQALAANPHFIRAGASGPDASGNLTVNFKMAGLGDNETVTITASADASALYACVNKGGHVPNAENKQASTGTVTASGDFTSGKNGQITGSLTVSPPGSSLQCPPGQTRALVIVSYTNVQVSGAGDAESIAGTFCRVISKIAADELGVSC